MDRDTDAPLRLESVLAIETSTRSGSVAVRLFGETLDADLAGERAHATDLLPSIDRLLGRLGARGPAFDAVVVGTGPGSYTGLRVGIATALGLARASGALLRGVPSFEALAFQELEPGEEGAIAIDARAGRFYHARYRRAADDVETIEAPRAVSPAELRRLLASPGVVIAERAVPEAAELGADVLARLRVDTRPRARALLELGVRRLARHGPHAPDEVEPLYLRSFGPAVTP